MKVKEFIQEQTAITALLSVGILSIFTIENDPVFAEQTIDSITVSGLVELSRDLTDPMADAGFRVSEVFCDSDILTATFVPYPE